MSHTYIHKWFEKAGLGFWILEATTTMDLGFKIAQSKTNES